MPITLNNDLSTMKVGEYFWCKYTATSGVVGAFSDFAKKTDAEVVGQEIPVASSATPNGYFRFIMVEDWNGKKRLVADRNIQHSISWDALNASGIASGSGLPLASISEQPSIENGFNRVLYSIRLLTGGTASTDKDNEWDKYIVGSNLGGAITAGDNNVWNWGGVWAWTSTVASASNANRTVRGNGTVAQYNHNVTTTLNGFRPVLEEYANEFAIFDKTLILHEGEYKRWNNPVKGSISTKTTSAIPTMTSNISPSGIVRASASLSANYDAWKAFDKLSGADTQRWLSNVNFPQWIEYEFPIPIIINRYSVLSSTASNLSPLNWKFQASNNGVDYFDIDSKVGENTTTLKVYDIGNVTPYKIYRMAVTQNRGGAMSGGYSVSIDELDMFEAIVVKEVKGGWGTTSSTLPTPTQFIEKGMDSLTPLLERKVMQLEPQVMDSKIGILPQGSQAKVFSKKLDLNKYMDVRKIEVK